MYLTVFKLNLTYSNIEYQLNCAYDRLIVRNGPFLNSPAVRTYCNNTDQTSANNTVTSDSRKMLIQFQTDHSRTGGGFRLEYKQVDQGNLGYCIEPVKNNG